MVVDGLDCDFRIRTACTEHQAADAAEAIDTHGYWHDFRCKGAQAKQAE